MTIELQTIANALEGDVIVNAEDLKVVLLAVNTKGYLMKKLLSLGAKDEAEYDLALASITKSYNCHIADLVESGEMKFLKKGTN